MRVGCAVWGSLVPARFLTDEQLATYGRYAADPPDQAVLERFFFLDDADRDRVTHLARLDRLRRQEPLPGPGQPGAVRHLRGDG
jgi:hypothetical protein